MQFPTIEWQQEISEKILQIDKIQTHGISTKRRKFITKNTFPLIENVIDTEKDGNCGFRALSFVITGTQHWYGKLRTAICDHIMKNYNFVPKLKVYNS